MKERKELEGILIKALRILLDDGAKGEKLYQTLI